MLKLLPFEESRPQTRLDNEFIRLYMPLAPEGHVKVYLYALMLAQGGAQSFDVAGALGMREEALQEALLYWQARGLLRLVPGEEPGVAFLAPAGAAPEAAAEGYSSFFMELHKCFGTRILSAAELRRAQDWVEVYGLSEAAVLMLARYCIERNERGAAVSFNYIESVARSWADQGLRDVRAAEAYLEEQGRARDGVSEVLRLLGKNRAPTRAEADLYEKWIAQGFTKEAVLLCCGELTAYGTPSLKALDNELQSRGHDGRKSEAAIEEYQRQKEEDRAFTVEFLSRMGLIRTPTRQDVEQVQVWRRAWHMPDALILWAAESAHGVTRRFMQARKRLESWHEAGVSTIEEAKAALEREKDEAKAKRTQTRKKKKAFTYMQQESTVDADAFIISLDDDED